MKIWVNIDTIIYQIDLAGKKSPEINDSEVDPDTRKPPDEKYCFFSWWNLNFKNAKIMIFQKITKFCNQKSRISGDPPAWAHEPTHM